MADETTTPAPATTPEAAPSPAATTSTSETFWQYVVNHVPHHLVAISIIIVIVSGIFLFVYIRDIRQQLANQAKVTATLSQTYQQLGTAAVAANTQQTQAQVTQTSSDVFGPAVVALMQQQNSKIDSLTTLIAQANQQTNTLQTPQLTAIAPHQDATTGVLSGYAIEENRGTLPPLGSMNLFYDPRLHDAATAFKGTTWNHYQEQFQTSVGNWEQQKTGGYKTTVKLSRTVQKPDPNDPTKMITIGTEDIPITGANTIYTPDGLQGTNPFVTPRWTANLGFSKDATNGYQLAGTVDYRVTDRYGVFAGTVNKAIVTGISIRFGAPK